jgi:hypothetical protein
MLSSYLPYHVPYISICVRFQAGQAPSSRTGKW